MLRLRPVIDDALSTYFPALAQASLEAKHCNLWFLLVHAMGMLFALLTFGVPLASAKVTTTSGTTSSCDLYWNVRGPYGNLNAQTAWMVMNTLAATFHLVAITSILSRFSSNGPRNLQHHRSEDLEQMLTYGCASLFGASFWAFLNFVYAPLAAGSGNAQFMPGLLVADGILFVALGITVLYYRKMRLHSPDLLVPKKQEQGGELL